MLLLKYISELSFLKVPFIVIPYKFATENHQLQNAQYLKNNNAALIINENELDNKQSYLIIKKLIGPDILCASLNERE